MLGSSPEAPPLAPDATVTGEGSTAGTAPLAAAESGGVQSAGPGGTLPNGLTKEVLGFLPYWLLTSESLASMRYDLVSTIAYFGIAARSDGTLTRSGATWSGWTSSALSGVINSAHARGVKVVPTITFMVWDGDYSGMSALLTSASRRARLISEIAGIIRTRNADGVNIDFEPVPTSLRGQFTTFIRELKAGLRSAGVRSYLTVDTMAGAASWATGYDVAALSASGAADALMVMAYDFSWSGSARAGGVAPMQSQYIFDASEALAAYRRYVPGNKLIWGVPYYGRAWSTQSRALNALTCRSTTVCPDAAAGAIRDTWAPRYIDAIAAAARYGRHWDTAGQVPWYRWYDSSVSSWYQGYYDDAASLGAKYGMVNSRGLAGVGIWTLLMDRGRSELWNTIKARFTHTVIRISGPDRYAAAAALSRASLRPGVPLVALATGEKFPDALAGAPLAAANGGPVLLVTRDAIPPATAAELARLDPKRIVILGGTASVSDRVLRAARAYTPGGVTRLAGADRYAAAATISRSFVAPGTATAYVATGTNFPDALAGAAVAARDRAPMLLVTPNSIPAATAAELARLDPGRIVVLGGTLSVSERVARGLGAYTSGAVSRLAGADRYAAAAAISRASYAADGPAVAYVATGEKFPDALAAAALAGRARGPVLLVPHDRLPSVVAAELRRLDPAKVIIVGGPMSVSESVRTAIANVR
jgi:spore germination protein YaaH